MVRNVRVKTQRTSQSPTPDSTNISKKSNKPRNQRVRQNEKNLNQYLQELSPESRKNVDARAVEILAEEMGLQDLRKALQYSQKALAEKLNVKQAEISKIEHRTDMLVSTLRAYVEQLGGSLEITVHFPGKQPIKITQFELDSSDQSDLATAS